MRSVLQNEAGECGLACLAMVAGHHGQSLTLRELRRRFPMSLKGASLAELTRIAARLGFRTRPLRLELSQLPRLERPAILHWDLDHFVVLAAAGRRRVTILDPALGRRRLRYAAVSPHFTGVALELAPAAAFARRKRPPAVRLRQLTGPVRGLGRALSLLFALSLALQILVVLGPFLLQWVVDQVLVSADRDLLAVLAAGFGLALLLQVGVTLLRGWAVAFLSARLALQWTGNVFAHLLKLPLTFFERRHLGDVVSRMGSVRSIQRTLTTSFIEAVIDGLMALLTFAMLLLYSRALAFLALAAVGAYALLRALTFGRVRETSEGQLVAAARQQSHLLESLRGMQSIKLAGIEPDRQAGHANLMQVTVNHDLRLAKLALGFNGASTLLLGTERIAAVSIGALLTLENAFSVGMLVACLAYRDQFAARIAGLIDKAVELCMLRLHGERLGDIVLTAPEESAGDARGTAPPASASIDVRGLSFRYAQGEPWVLKELALTVDDGESVAVVGPSGCGKTTLVRLLAGLLRPTAGSIGIGGRDVSSLGAAAHRRMIGAVMQDDRLFTGTIADNIALGDPSPDPARVEAAARLAAVHEEIAGMPMAYDSLIGDMGTSLSGGQKQRVLLARALYRRPRILILDEATSHLDLHRERRVNDAVRQLRLTRLVVAHRRETIAAADRVLVLEGGRIAREVRGRRSAPARRGPGKRAAGAA